MRSLPFIMVLLLTSTVQAQDQEVKPEVKPDPEVTQLRQRVDQLQAQLARLATPAPTVKDQQDAIGNAIKNTKELIEPGCKSNRGRLKVIIAQRGGQPLEITATCEL